MKLLVLLALVFGGLTAQAQTIKFKIENQPDTTVYLVKYFGKNPYYADTAIMKNGAISFDASKQEAGVLALYIPGQNFLEFLYNGEKETYIEATGPNFMGTAVVKKSVENQIFISYVQFIADKKSEAGRMSDQRKAYEKGDPKYEEFTKIIDGINKVVADRQLKISTDHAGLLVGKVIRMSMEVNVPESPIDEAGNEIDPHFRFNYYRTHYWDNVDLRDDRLVRSQVFDNKMSYYFGDKMIVQHWDTIIKYAYEFIDRLDPNSDMFHYVVSTLASKYEKSTTMGMNKVFIYLGKKYYCAQNAEGKSPAHWMPEDKLTTLCEKVDKHINLVMGAIPPNIKLKDTTDVVYHDFMSLKSDYTILYFWDPDCGHCKKITPKLQTLYEKKWKARNIEIFAVAKASGNEFQKWKDFVRINNLQFINVGVTKSMYEAARDMTNNQYRLQQLLLETDLNSLNYQSIYDIVATPKVWVLDKDKKIIAYSLTVSQLEDMLDRLQKMEDSEKLFPPEKDLDVEQMH